VHTAHRAGQTARGARTNDANCALAGVARASQPPERMNAIPTPDVSPLARPIGYHGAVCDFTRRLIEATLHQPRGNRTHAARALGLQRTYLLRLIRELGVAAPPPPVRRRAG
jgi:DNA-binding NtrC family response regulator